MAATEIRALTGIRGAAAVFVMIYHLQPRPTSSGLLSNVLNHGYLSVDLFFVLSGFVMAHVYGQSLESGAFRFRTFLWHRFARIYPLYIIVTLAIVLRDYTKTSQLDADGATLASNMVMLQTLGAWSSINAPAWSVSAEMVAYLLFPIIGVLSLKSSRIVALCAGVVAIGAILAMTIAASFHEIGLPISTGLLDLFYEPYGIIRCLAGFTLGQLAWRLHNDPRIAAFASKNVVQIAIAMLVVLAVTQIQADFTIYLLIIGLILCLSTDRGILSAFFGSPPIYFLGVVSFAVYLTHFRAFGIWTSVENMLEGYGTTAANLVATIVSCLFVIAISWLLHIAIEKPCRQLLRSLGSRKPRTVPVATGVGTRPGD